MRRVEAMLAAMWLAGCAGTGTLFPEKPRAQPLFRDPALSVDGAARVLANQPMSRRELEERLGPAERLAFASGYEVWVYRAREQPRGTESPELVILINPQGNVSKVRVRSASGQ